MMNERELSDLERHEHNARARALYEPSDWSRRQARDAEVDTYRAELGDDNDD